jgi:hypothetical protein
MATLNCVALDARGSLVFNGRSTARFGGTRNSMKTTHLLTWLALGALAYPLSSFANAETLTYTGSAFTSSYSTGNFLGEVGNDSYFTAALTLSSPLGANLNGANVSSEVTSLVFTTVDPSAPSADRTDILNLTALQAEGSQFLFSTNSAGAITGWSFTSGITTPGLSSTADVIFHSCSNESCAGGSYNGQNYAGTGDWYDYKPGSGTASDGCTYEPSNGCGSTGGQGSVGKWVIAAPELNSMNAGSGLFLLIGSLAVMRGRRRINEDSALACLP